jgi:hypothetical protein
VQSFGRTDTPEMQNPPWKAGCAEIGIDGRRFGAIVATFCFLGGKFENRRQSRRATLLKQEAPPPTVLEGTAAAEMLELNFAYATATAIGAKIDGLSFSGAFTRVEIGHIRIGPAGNGRINSRGSGSSLSQRA